MFSGTVSGNITNAKGSTVSTKVGTVSVTLDSTSKWSLTADTYITEFTGDPANVINNGYTLYVNDTALEGTSESGELPTQTQSNNSAAGTNDLSSEASSNETETTVNNKTVLYVIIAAASVALIGTVVLIVAKIRKNNNESINTSNSKE